MLPAPVKRKADAPAVPRRALFGVHLSPALTGGDNVIAVRVDNRRITELFLGGILRPVVLVDTGMKP